MPVKSLSDFPDAHLRIFQRPPVPDSHSIRNVYLIGICGTGMGSLAGLFREAGFQVSGSDLAAYPPMSTRLRELGIPVHEGFDPGRLDPAPDLVIVGNACTPTHVEASFARERHLVQQSLPEALAHFFLRDRRPLVVAGTHGKTTTTGLLVHLLQSAGEDPGYLVGGILAGSGSSYASGRGRHFVVEGDEYDSAYFDKRPKFLHYRPASAIVTSIEFDHADIYEGLDDYRQAFETFVALLPADGLLVLHGDDPAVRDLARTSAARVRTYGLDTPCDVTAAQIGSGPDGQAFDLVVAGETLTRLFLPMSGRHNLLNTLAACTIALDEGVSPGQLRAGLSSFKGLKRRQEIRGDVAGILVVDDFAHHPTAVRETIRAIRQRWPGRRLVAVFEPRSNSSRRKVFESAYGDAFIEADAVFLSAPPMRHNDRPEDFMDVAALADRVNSGGVPVVVGPDADALLPQIRAFLRPGDVALFMSNGGFGNIHQRLIEALAEDHQKSVDLSAVR